MKLFKYAVVAAVLIAAVLLGMVIKHDMDNGVPLFTRQVH